MTDSLDSESQSNHITCYNIIMKKDINSNYKSNDKKHNKMLLISAIAISLIACLVFAWFKMFYISDNWQLHISDVSKACYSNALNIYSDKGYIVISATGGRIIHSGRSDYKKSIDYLESKIRTYQADKESLMNYEVITNNGSTIYVDQNNSPELREFLNTIDVENLFWCS